MLGSDKKQREQREQAKKAYAERERMRKHNNNVNGKGREYWEANKDNINAARRADWSLTAAEISKIRKEKRIAKKLQTMTEDDRAYKFFLAGWEACKKKTLFIIDEESKNWLLNGPSLETANAIKKYIRNIPIPKPEGNNKDDINGKNN